MWTQCTHRAEQWGLAVRLSVSLLLSLLIITPAHMYTHTEILICLVLILMFLLTSILRNSCKVKQNQPMQKDLSGQVRISSYTWLMRSYKLLKSFIQSVWLIIFSSVKGWPSWISRHRRGEVGEQCLCQTRQGRKQWVKRINEDWF